MSATRLQEILIGFGIGKQTDIATANLVAVIWRLKKLNAQLANPKLNTENDEQSMARATSLRRNTFVTSWDIGARSRNIWARRSAPGRWLRAGQGREVGTTPTSLTPAPR